ncbi:hypothetical protein [Rhizobium ruizarguesonis]|uniref:hypothetical protein n=1 Tax=Rhizobium ruizarguesonis TaxID=2081791 RepID=UPI001FE017E3|nr:hypothetical protein [Rhizobium ruizarguesonis]
MSRFEETETALTDRLRALKMKPDMTVNLFDIGVPMNAAGFSQDEILAVSPRSSRTRSSISFRETGFGC